MTDDDDVSSGVKRPWCETDLSQQLMPRSRMRRDTPVHSLYAFRACTGAIYLTETISCWSNFISARIDSIQLIIQGDRDVPVQLAEVAVRSEWKDKVNVRLESVLEVTSHRNVTVVTYAIYSVVTSSRPALL